MQFTKCKVCGRLIVAGSESELAEEERHHAELDEAAFAAFRKLFPNWVGNDGTCAECAASLRDITTEPSSGY